MFNNLPFPPEDALPPQEVRFTELRVEPWPDGRRVRIHVGVTPFQQKPNIDAGILNEQNLEVAHTTVVENMDIKLVFTMHIRGPIDTGRYTLTASLSYDDVGTVDEKNVAFETHEAPSQEP